MSEKLPSKADFGDVSAPEGRILLATRYWSNGNLLQIRGKERGISTAHDVPLERLFRGSRWDYELHKDAHDRLLSSDLLQEEYLCQRKVNWGRLSRACGLSVST